MRSWCRQACVGVAVVAACFACSPAAATPDDLAALPPVVDPYLCLICHQTDPGVTGDSSLNSFGDDFQANGRVWDEVLAAMNSDGDDCSNGVELGDVDGNGQNEGNIGEELQSNPGVDDCAGASVDSRTWGELKALFDQK